MTTQIIGDRIACTYPFHDLRGDLAAIGDHDGCPRCREHPGIDPTFVTYLPHPDRPDGTNPTPYVIVPIELIED